MSELHFRNEILRRLGPEIIGRLELRRVDLPANRVIELPGKKVVEVLFLESGVAAMTTAFENGSQVQIALTGEETVLGTSCMMGTRRSLNRVFMQVAGHGHTAPTAAVEREFKRGGTFHDLTLHSLQAQFLQSAQTAGCNAVHSVDQRLARWLLLCADRMKDGLITVSQDSIADMLGVSRPSVSIAAATFQRRGLIQYARGKIRLIDREKLQVTACECYLTLRNYLHDLAEFDGIAPPPATSSTQHAALRQPL